MPEQEENYFEDLITLDYVRLKAAEMSPTDLLKVTLRREEIGKILGDPAFDAVREKTLGMLQIIDGIAKGDAVKISYPSLSVAVFGLNYLLKEVDIIPDQIPGEGYKDDALVLDRCAEQMGRELKHWKVAEDNTDS